MHFPSADSAGGGESMISVTKGPISETPGEVLIVDDEAAMRAALEVSFARRGWQVETAAGKADALARFRQRRHSLVVSDVRMADGDGFSVMREVREIRSQTAVILLTGFGSVADAVEAIKSGACEYLTKPVAFDELLESAKRIVARNSQTSFAQLGSDKSEMIGSSPALRLALERARQAAASDADILIEAES